MSEHSNMDKPSIKDTADAIKGVAEAVPVYQDVLQPAAKEIGTALQTVAKAVHVALAPVSALVWGYEQIKEYVTRAVSEKLKDTPKDRIIPPSPTVAGPVLEALRYAGHQESLADLYTNLLATSMDAKTAKEAHPAFVEVLKQLSPDEAKILKVMCRGQNFPVVSVYKHVTAVRDGKEQSTESWVLRRFSMLPYQAECQYPELGPTYLENICRLGLAILPEGGWGVVSRMSGDEVYQPLFQHPVVVAAKGSIRVDQGESPEVRPEVIRVITFGRQFIDACVAPSQHT